VSPKYAKNGEAIEIIFTQLRDSWEQQKGLTNSLQEWYRKYQNGVSTRSRDLQIAVRRDPESHVFAASTRYCPTRNAPAGNRISRTEKSNLPRHCADEAQIPGNVEVKLDQLNSQMASLVQALHSCQQNMVLTSDLEALKDIWSKDVGHSSVQMRNVLAQKSRTLCSHS